MVSYIVSSITELGSRIGLVLGPRSQRRASSLTAGACNRTDEAKQYCRCSCRASKRLSTQQKKAIWLDVELQKLHAGRRASLYAKGQNPELFDTINANGDYNDEIDGACKACDFVALKAW
ncbi:hypothetical protein O9929_23320 [Vibrio lentus]|nr:hypothetical protein [Vibrio lentus]